MKKQHGWVSNLFGLKTGSGSFFSLHNNILINHQISIIIQSQGKGIQWTGWGAFHISSLNIELPSMAWA
jgi:hypothetical protein